MNRLDIIQSVIDRIKAKTYIEVGVEGGITFFPIKIKRKIAIDPKSQIAHLCDNITSQFFKMTSDTFFEEHSDVCIKNGIDVAFIDGMHTYKQSLKDFNNCLQYLNNGGVIIIHDCSPTTKVSATIPIEKAEKMDGWNGLWCGNVWKTIIRLRSTQNDLNIFVVNEDYGVGVITRGKPEDMLNYSINDIDNMTYKDLDINRKEILNLKEFEYFDNLYNK